MTEADLEEVLAIENDSFPLPWSRDHFLDELKNQLMPFRWLPLIGKIRLSAISVRGCFWMKGIFSMLPCTGLFAGEEWRGSLVERVLDDCREGGGAVVLS